MVQGQRAVRPLLLILVAFGIACMHTLGHPHSHGGHDCAGQPPAIMGAHQPPAGPHTGAAAAAGITAATIGPAACGTGMLLDPFTVCLAILVAGLVVLLAALVMAGRRLRSLRGHIRAALVVAGRGPPPRPGLGLRLADLSVLRT